MKKTYYKRNENAKAVSVLDKEPQEKFPAIKEEWRQNDFKAIQKAICAHFNGKEVKTLHGIFMSLTRTYQWYVNKFGLPYTSSSSFAALWVTNTEVYCEAHPGYNYEGFALGVDGIPYAFLKDNEENEILLPL